jgi:hypothetical protein
MSEIPPSGRFVQLGILEILESPTTTVLNEGDGKYQRVFDLELNLKVSNWGDLKIPVLGGEASS